MSIAIIVGSQHKQSQSAKVGRVIADILQQHNIQSTIIDLGKQHLPYYDEDNHPGTTQGEILWQTYKEILSSADGVIVITPERSGMVPGVLKNFFLRCKDNELAHKPGMLVAVSSGTGGAYPIAELRMSSYKNTKICYMPDHVIVRHVNDVLNGEDTPDSQKIYKRLQDTISMLLVYVDACKQIRSSDVYKTSGLVRSTGM